jgi:putative glutamine amidotransferase
MESIRTEAESIMLNAGGLLLTGGGDVLLAEEPDAPPDRAMDRDRDFWEAALFDAALRFKRPVLGVCRGLQLMNVALGGTLWDDIPSQCPGALNHQQRTTRPNTSHKVILEPDSQLAALCGRTELLVNSGHHQGIRALARELRVVGRSEDGIIEAVECPGYNFVVGAQWHPEALIGSDAAQLALFEGLVNEASVDRVWKNL